MEDTAHPVWTDGAGDSGSAPGDLQPPGSPADREAWQPSQAQVAREERHGW